MRPADRTQRCDHLAVLVRENTNKVQRTDLVRPYTHTDHYWQVYFDTNKAITETFGAAGYPVPEAHYCVQQKTA